MDYIDVVGVNRRSIQDGGESTDKEKLSAAYLESREYGAKITFDH